MLFINNFDKKRYKNSIKELNECSIGKGEEVINKIWAVILVGGCMLCFLQGRTGKIPDELLEGTKEAVDLFMVMGGAVAMWSGFMKIAEKSGIVELLSEIMLPVLKRLFPKIPPHHKAMHYISMNVSANMLGLGWAATPSGIMAVKELDKLNCKKGRATDEMCMFLIINMSSVQLISINIISYRMKYGSADPAAIVFPGIIATAISTLAAISACKWCERKEK